MKQSLAGVSERLWRRVRRGPYFVCWEWTGALNTSGYGKIFIRRTAGRVKVEETHRVAWRLSRGKMIPRGRMVLHRCDNRVCCNPRHLYLGDALRNARDRDARGRRKPPSGSLNGRAVLTEDEVRRMRRIGGSPTMWAASLGIGKSTAADILRGRTWRHV